MVKDGETVVVVTDANVLINHFCIEQLPLLGALQGHRFLVPEEVVAEILDPAQREAVAAAIAAGHLEQVLVDTMQALALCVGPSDFPRDRMVALHRGEVHDPHPVPLPLARARGPANARHVSSFLLLIA